MRIFIIISISLFTLNTFSQQKKQLQFFQTSWGRTVSWDAFCEKTKASGYDGIETWLPSDNEDRSELEKALAKYNLKVAFLNGTNSSIPFKKSLSRYTANFKTLIALNPAYINSHTGNDFFTYEQNKAFIDAANTIAKENNIPIYHETHRGRFSYNLPDTKKYMKSIPELKLTLDISHWMVVHESLLLNKDEELEEVLQRTHHIHARVGHAESPQVNDPEAPEWKKAVDRHMDIWEKVIRLKWKTQDVFTITTEFGPAHYMPTLPYTQVPVADQWKANKYMMRALKERLNID
ncbi:sugar phosphate isomerase/epimerase [Maribacter sp. MJ134]|uniref:sugar phosphate isomerase/epimerase family protein n=1 Tax=Maribacter sp. MJ134 TaxID=2496865 RepID=UPI000F820213|nr:sugar phosphate isomerase/epimerase [Maribacter sp. MJ134]AZQ60418.1 sugar phosphate isomerase/epimerase [Maribacter sp. MJ134]